MLQSRCDKRIVLPKRTLTGTVLYFEWFASVVESDQFNEVFMQRNISYGFQSISNLFPHRLWSEKSYILAKYIHMRRYEQKRNTMKLSANYIHLNLHGDVSLFRSVFTFDTTHGSDVSVELTTGSRYSRVGCSKKNPCDVCWFTKTNIAIYRKYPFIDFMRTYFIFEYCS